MQLFAPSSAQKYAQNAAGDGGYSAKDGSFHKLDIPTHKCVECYEIALLFTL
jgi:hypothetical protein